MLHSLMVLAFTALFLLSFLYIWKRDKLFAVYYLCLFIYTVFTQIGYTILPEVAQEKQLFFFRDLFMEYWLFMSLSFAAIFILFALSRGRLECSRGISMAKMSSPWRSLALYGGTAAFLGILLSYARAHAIELNYITQVSTEGGQVYAYGSGLLLLLLMALYVKIRRYSYTPYARIAAVLAFISGLAVFLYITLLGGDRSRMISLIMGVFAYELIPFGVNFKVPLRKIGTFVVGALLAILFIQRVASIRGFKDASIDYFIDKSVAWDDFIGNIRDFVGQDYFAPSNLLFASMRFHYIHPGEVLLSNLHNTLLFQNYPTLSESVGGLIMETSRKQGTAYYILVEGYNALGWGGVVYNAVVIVGGLAIWRWLASSNNDNYNRFMSSVMVSLMVSMVRSQSCYFIKNIYLAILPSMLLFCLISGYRPRLTKSKIHSGQLSQPAYSRLKNSG